MRSEEQWHKQEFQLKNAENKIVRAETPEVDIWRGGTRKWKPHIYKTKIPKGDEKEKEYTAEEDSKSRSRPSGM